MWKQDNDNDGISFNSMIKMYAVIFITLWLWDAFYMKPRQSKQINQSDNIVKNQESTTTANPLNAKTNNLQDQNNIKHQFIPIISKRLSAQLKVPGLTLGNALLYDYKDDVADEKILQVLSPFDDKDRGYYITSGIAKKHSSNATIPDSRSNWNYSIEVKGAHNGVKEHESKLSSDNDSKLILSWQDGDRSVRTIYTIVDDYLIHVKQHTTGYHKDEIKGYVTIKRNNPSVSNDHTMYDGIVGYADNEFKEISNKRIIKKKSLKYKLNKRSWIGLSDKYWMTAIIPIINDAGNHYANIKGIQENNKHSIQAEVGINYTEGINNESNLVYEYYIFVGPKDIGVLDKYAQKYNIQAFDKSIDFGLIYIIGKPILMILKFIYNIVGNYGWSIVILTIFIRVLLWPITRKSHISSIKMKALQPQMKLIQEQFKDDKIGLGNAMLAMYKKNNVSPMSGILPLLLQAPVFFALYKVLNISIEMRHSPFIFWIKDLASMDPTSVLNLFGLIPVSLPSFMIIGVLPCIMGLTMWIQQKMGNAMPDGGGKLMKFLPLALVFLFAKFTTGLLIYWIVSNIFSILQQYWLIKTYKN